MRVAPFVLAAFLVAMPAIAQQPGVAASHLRDGIDVGEVDDLTNVGARQSRRVCVAVDRDDPPAQLLDPLERPPLVASGPHEEDRGHRRHFFGSKRKACLSQREISQP